MAGQSKPVANSAGSPGGRKPTNPYKKQSPGQRNSSKMNKAVQHVLTAYGFGTEATFEIYNYSVGSPVVGWKEGYTLYLRQFVDGDHTVLELEQAGVNGYYFMRVRIQVNEAARGADNWPRFMILRILPEGVFSSRSSIQQGFGVLRAFLMNKNYSLYPPNTIASVDATNYDAPLSLDNFILDSDVAVIMGLMFEQDVLTPSFAGDFPTIAPIFFGGPVYPQVAVERFGYGLVRVAGMAPGFVPGPGQRNEHAEASNESEQVADVEGNNGGKEAEDASTAVVEDAMDEDAAPGGGDDDKSSAGSVEKVNSDNEDVDVVNPKKNQTKKRHTRKSNGTS